MQAHRTVALFPETSQAFLERMQASYPGEQQQILDPALFFLDAHGYGFAWPLRREVRFYTRKFRGGFLLIDDFRVPPPQRSNASAAAAAGGQGQGQGQGQGGGQEEEFGYDEYKGQECSFAFIEAELPPQSEVAWRLHYPRSATPVLGDELHSRSLEEVYATPTAGEPPRSACLDDGRCTNVAAAPKPKPRGWGLIAFGSLAKLPVDEWLPHLVRKAEL